MFHTHPQVQLGGGASHSISHQEPTLGMTSRCCWGTMICTTSGLLPSPNYLKDAWGAGQSDIYIYICMYVHVCVYIYAYIYTHAYVYMQIQFHTYIYTHVHTYVYIDSAVKPDSHAPARKRTYFSGFSDFFCRRALPPPSLPRPGPILVSRGERPSTKILPNTYLGGLYNSLTVGRFRPLPLYCESC